MNTDLVDVVDNNDNMVGEIVTVHEAHESSLFHRIRAVLVFTEEGKLYVQVRNEPGFRRDHTAAGHVDAGETYYDAAIREMKEEIDLEVPIELVATGIFEDDERLSGHARGHVFGVYTATVKEDWGFRPNDEVVELLLMDVAEILKDMKQRPDAYTHGFVKTLDAYIKWKKK